MKVNLLSLFSGIEGFCLGLRQGGFEINKHYYSEIDKYATQLQDTTIPMESDLEQLQLFQESELQTESISLLSEALARIYHLLENGKDWQAVEAGYSLKRFGLLGSCSQIYLSGKMLKERSQAAEAKTILRSLESLPTLGFMSANGSCLILGGYYPKIESGYTLSDILEEQVSEKYFLSEKALKFLDRKEKDLATGFRANILSVV
jgi:hypothetical protein